MRFHQHRVRDTGDRICSGIEEGLAGNRLFGRFHIRHDVFGRLLRAGGKSRQRERCAHDLQEIAAAFIVDPFRRLPGEFAVQEVLETFDRSQLVEAAPVASPFGLLQLRPNGRQIQRIAIFAHLLSVASPARVEFLNVIFLDERAPSSACGSVGT